MMQFATPHQASCNIGRLPRRAFGWEMRCKIADNSDEDVPALGGRAPPTELLDARFQHLVAMESCVFPQYCMG